jgi:2'-5' RNA ligase
MSDPGVDAVHVPVPLGSAGPRRKPKKEKPVSKSMHVSMTKALSISAELEDAEFTMAVEEARKLGLTSVEIVTVDTDGDNDGLSDLYVARPNGLMIAWKPREWQRDRFSVPGGCDEDDLHMTVLYLGHAEDFDTEQQRTIIGVVSQVASQHTQLQGTITGFGRFIEPNEDDETAIYLGVAAPGLQELHDELATALKDAGITWEDTYDTYVPHITLAMIPADAETPQVLASPDQIAITNLNVYIGGLEYEIDLEDLPYDGEGGVPMMEDEEHPNMYYPVVLSKSAQVLDDEKQYSYGAWYVPDSVDAHGEWADRDTVQESLWKYVDSGNRDIHAQHIDDLVAGRWVELATIPFPVSVPVEVEPGILRKHTYPAGTPFMGVIWEDWAWPLVKSGDFKGFSVGGTAHRIEADFPDAALQKAATAARKG